MRKAVRIIVVHNDALLVIHRNKFGSEYYTLPGGGVEYGESLEQALVREVHEETSLKLENFRHVLTEEAGPMFGTQFIFLADYVGGEPQLHPSSEEAQIHALGQNLYTPVWLNLNDLPAAEFRTAVLKEAILDGLKGGFSDQPRTIR